MITLEKPLIDKVKEEVLKTGFPLELRVADLLVKRGYYTAHSLYYVDEDEGKAREVDLRALKNVEWHDPADNWSRWYVRHCLLLECKKSDNKPWVFTSSRTNSYDPDVTGIPTKPKELSWNVLRELHEAMPNIHPFSHYTTRGRGYFEAFKGFETGDMIMKALSTAVKATLYTMKQGFAAHGQSAVMYYPVVVYDGKLFEATLSGNDVDVVEVDSLLVPFMYESSVYSNGSFSVPVLTERALPSFLDSLERFLVECSGLAHTNRARNFMPADDEGAT